MKRTLISAWMVGVACLAMAQKPISDLLNIPGTMKSYYSWRDEVKVEKGTPCVLQFITRLKKYESGEGAYQAVLSMGNKQFYVPLSSIGDYFRPESMDKDVFWCMNLLDKYPDFSKKDDLVNLRHERRQDSDKYILELKNSNMFYEDAAIEDYLQCLLLSLLPEKAVFGREVTKPVVRLLKSAAPDMVLLGNDVLLVSTGMLATLDTEDELVALLVREVSHHLLDHALVTMKKNIARANRAAFGGSVIDGVVAATEVALYERYDYYQPGLLFETNDLIQAFVNEKIAKRMGLDYAPKMEWEADEFAVSYLEYMGKSKQVLASALYKLNEYYQRENDVSALSKYGAYGTLEERVQKWGKPDFQPVDRGFLKRMMGVVSFEAAMQDYNKRYPNARLLAMKNINNHLACADDYLMVARSLMKESNTSESNRECLLYLDKAELVSEVENINVTKMRILLFLRENMRLNAVDMVKKYQRQLDALYQQPHTDEDAQWIAAEHLWAEKLLKGMYID